MSRHVHVTCPNCHRPDIRKVRPEYINRRVQCKYCNHVFRARLPAAVPDSVTVAENGEAERRSDLLKTEVRADRKPAEAVDGTGTKPEEDTGALQIRSLKVELRTAQEQIEALRAELQTHREREVEQTARRQTSDEAIRERDEIAAERDRLLGDRDRLEGEINTLRAELEARSVEAARLETTAAAFEAARAERDRLEADGRQAANEAGETQRRLEEQEQALAAAVAEHEEARRTWNAQGKALSEQQKTLTAELEARSVEAVRLGTLTAELEAARAERDRFEAEVRQAASEAGETRRRLDELEQSLAAATAEHEEAHSQWEAERRELIERQKTERRNLLAEAERRTHEQSESDRLRNEKGRSELQQEAERLRSKVKDAAEERDKALRQVVEVLAERDAFHARLSQASAAQQDAEQALLVERDRLAAALDQVRQESQVAARRGEALEVLRQEHEAARRQAEQIQAAHDGLRRQADVLDTERDRLDRELDEARSLLANRSRELEELDARVLELETALDQQRQHHAAEARERARELDALRLDRDAERTRGAEREAAWQQAKEIGETFRKEAEQLRADLDGARRLADELRGRCEGLITEHKEAASRQGVEINRLAATLDQSQKEAQTAATRAETLEGQLRTLREESERLRKELEAARAERDAERARGASGEAARVDLQRRLGDALREQRQALGRIEQLEAEVRATREQPPAAPAAHAPPAPHASVGNGGTGVEDLARKLQLAQEANERLRAFLAVFGTPRQKIGKDAE